jgi:hypothetical protein
MTHPASGEIMMHGIVKDLPASLIAADKWSNGRNVYFKSGKTIRMPGAQPFANSGRLFAVQFLRFVRLPNGSQYWLYGGDAGIAVTDGVTHYNITPAGWGAITGAVFSYSLGDLNGVPFVNHPQRGPYWWNGNPASVMTKLPNWPTGWTCGVMRAHKNFLMALNVDTPTGRLESQVSWSTSAAPGQVPSDWVPSPTNDAGDADFSATRGPLQDGISVRDQFFVMKNEYTGTLQYVGGQFIFQTRDVFPSIGIFATDCCCEDGNLVYMLTANRRMIKHDGNSYTDMLYGVMGEYFSTALNYNKLINTFVYRNMRLGQVVLAYPVGTNTAANEAITIEIASGDASIIDLPDVWMVDMGLLNLVPQTWDIDTTTWDSDTTTWDETASGVLPSTPVYAAGSAGMLSENGAPTMPAFVQRSGIDLDKLTNRKVMSGLRPLINGITGDVLRFSFGSQDLDSDVLTFDAVADFTLGTDRTLDFFTEGRLLAINVATTTANPFTLTQLSPQARLGGRF